MSGATGLVAYDRSFEPIGQVQQNDGLLQCLGGHMRYPKMPVGHS